ncbi:MULTISPECIES: single-stranded DNA-binding protein [Odoribacteraceae]|uniref:single-stranded DNA-binding protein n=1 Tax=Odoribacteraceae TaxID=1853231 RepID=UPI0018F31F9D|nr:single-stranded DNA-binding protein [Odoribacter sp. AF15-53]MCQ4874318.1 single-stranded DNA-binding protein [Butyricimonas paravirosa]
MMVNKVILIGNVGADPDVKYLEGGVAVARFSLATSEVYNNKNGERVTQTEWHNIVLWRNLAQIAEKYVKKGMMLYVEGRLRTRSWDDQNGVKRYTTEIYGDNFQMLSRKQDNGEKPQDTSMPQAPDLGGSDDSDDLPF